MKPELPAALSLRPPGLLRIWWTAVRPRTLTIAATPVIAGTALALGEGNAWRAAPMLAALFAALCIQAGTNLHNDAADFERGTDRPDRGGPLRVTAAGWASPSAVRRAALTSFGLAFALGIYLVLLGGWPILAAGIASLLAGWAYSGGRHPLSHTPLGEVFVLVFFGLVAVAGSHYLQTGHTSASAWLAGLILGLPAAAVLLVNNHRDREGDVQSGRRTLAAVIGAGGSRALYGALMLAPFPVLVLLAGAGPRGVLLAALVLPLHLLLIRRMNRARDAAALNLLLAGTARAGFILGLLLSVGALL